MSDRTGRKAGTIDPVVFFERADGYVILPVYDAGNHEMARQIFEKRYKYHPTEKWEYRTTGEDIRDVHRLQDRLIAQEERRDQMMLNSHLGMREQVRKGIRDSLYQRMISASTPAFEREFINLYLDLREQSKRDKWAQEHKNRQSYMWALEMDAGTKVSDRMPSQPGEFWRTPEQQR